MDNTIDIIIRIPEEEYNIIKNFKGPLTWSEHLIAKGIPLPKGHGKIIDESTITEVYTQETEPREINGMPIYPRIEIIGTNAQTIIEADKTESED